MTGRLTSERLAEIEAAVAMELYATGSNAKLRDLLAEVDALKADLDEKAEDYRIYRAESEPIYRQKDALEEANRQLRAALGNLFGDLYLHHLGEITDAQLWASGDRAETRVRIALGDSGGDPVEVRPSESRAGSQAGLNGPGGSPTSPPGRDLDSTPGETKEPA